MATGEVKIPDLTQATALTGAELVVVYQNGITKHALASLLIAPDSPTELIRTQVINVSGSTITKGTPVYATGVSTDIISVEPADCTTFEKSRIIGFAQDDILDTQTGYVVKYGLLEDVNTLSLASETFCFLSATAGTLQTTQQVTSGYYNVCAAYCINQNATTGKLFVNTFFDELIKETKGEITIADNSTYELTVGVDTLYGFTIDFYALRDGKERAELMKWIKSITGNYISFGELNNPSLADLGLTFALTTSGGNLKLQITCDAQIGSPNCTFIYYIKTF